MAAQSYAAESKTLSIARLVDQYYAKKETKNLSSKLFGKPLVRPPINCNPEPARSCTDVVCDRLGQFGCDDISEIQQVGRLCRGNYDGNCIESVCDKLGQFGCDDMNEVQAVGRACVGNYDTSCFESVCQRLGQFGCDDMNEVEEVLRTCAGN
jgi:hypothetical protein